MNNEASEPLTGIKKLQFRLGYIGEEESSKIGLSFIPSPDDVFITTFPKCGTTWVSFILHSLRSRGNMDFCEITEVVPWTIMAHMCKQDLNGPQRYNPRLFKSHEDYNAVPKGGKYVYVVRNPPEVIVSYYEFLQNVAKMNPGDVDFREFFNEMICKYDSVYIFMLCCYICSVAMNAEKNAVFCAIAGLPVTHCVP